MSANPKRQTRRALEHLVRRWRREAIELRREVSDTNLKWNADRRIFAGALQLLKEAGLAPGSAELLAAAGRAASQHTEITEDEG